MGSCWPQAGAGGFQAGAELAQVAQVGPVLAPSWLLYSVLYASVASAKYFKFLFYFLERRVEEVTRIRSCAMIGGTESNMSHDYILQGGWIG